MQTPRVSVIAALLLALTTLLLVMAPASAAAAALPDKKKKKTTVDKFGYVDHVFEKITQCGHSKLKMEGNVSLYTFRRDEHWAIDCSAKVMEELRNECGAGSTPTCTSSDVTFSIYLTKLPGDKRDCAKPVLQRFAPAGRTVPDCKST
jgi:hypothetical protein